MQWNENWESFVNMNDKKCPLKNYSHPFSLSKLLFHKIHKKIEYKFPRFFLYFSVGHKSKRLLSAFIFAQWLNGPFDWLENEHQWRKEENHHTNTMTPIIQWHRSDVWHWLINEDFSDQKINRGRLNTDIQNFKMRSLWARDEERKAKSKLN